MAMRLSMEDTSVSGAVDKAVAVAVDVDDVVDAGKVVDKAIALDVDEVTNEASVVYNAVSVDVAVVFDNTTAMVEVAVLELYPTDISDCPHCPK